MNIAQWLEQNIGVRMLMVHDTIYKRTNGRIGHRIPLPGVPPSLLLHTVGAKTGKHRTNTLSYFPDRGDYLVVASKGGDPKAPGWYHNLKADPNVEIRDIDGERSLWVGIEFTEPDVKDKVIHGTIANVSAGLEKGFTDPISGKTWPWVLWHVALTNKPVLKDLQPFIAASLDGLDVRVYKCLSQPTSHREGFDEKSQADPYRNPCNPDLRQRQPDLLTPLRPFR